MGEISRRNFLKGATALGAVAALGGAASTLEPRAAFADGEGKRSEVKHSWCYMCGPAKTICSTLCYLENGKFVHVEGNPKREITGATDAVVFVPRAMLPCRLSIILRASSIR